MISKSFPRGGKKPSSRSRNDLFSKNKLKMKKGNCKHKFSNESTQKNEILLLNTAQNLKYSTLCEGMIILGRIFKVTEYYAIVSLPGQIIGKVQATDICESYTNLLKNIADDKKVSDEFKTLSNIYKQGDYIICYIKKIHFQTGKVSLSAKPKLINEKLNPSFLTKYSKLALTVSSIEDHGYVLETGLKNLRAFLYAKNVQDVELKLHIGKQILCAVKNIKKADRTFTAEVSLKSKYINYVESIVLSLDNLVPGAQFSLVVKKVLKDGLQVHFDEKNIGYVSQFYIQQALSHFEKGQELVGTLLYIVPTTKLAYFSLLSQEQERKSIVIGDVTEAQTLVHDSRGIFVQLEKGIRGYIPLKQAGVDFEKIQSICTFNSIQKCKVIAYDSISKLYICSVVKEVLKRQYTNLHDLQTGNIVDVFVTSIDKENGYISVSSVTGKILGTVPPDQIVDLGSENNLRIGDIVKARVLDSSEKILFTLKKSLVESEWPILCKFEDAKVNEIHHGSVIKITNEGVLVRFFNNIKGWIPKRFLNDKNILKNWNLTLGETITAVIKAVNTDENNITLALSDRDITVSLEIGDIVEGIVTDSSAEGVHLQIEKYNCNVIAYLPAGHMSPCLEVGKLLAAKTVAGDKLSVVVFSIKPNLIMSATFSPQKTYSNISNLTSGDIVLCSVKKVYKKSIKVLLPIKNFQKYGTVPITDAENIEAMYTSQILYGKVVQTVSANQEISLTTQFSKLWKGIVDPEVQMMSAVDVLSSYLNKMLDLSKNVFYTNKPLSKINIGQRIKGTILSIMSDGLVLNLEGNIKGIVRKDNFLETYKNGEQVEGSVLWINYPCECIDLSLLPTVMKSISIKQNKLEKIPLGIQLRGEIVLVTNWFVLVILKGQSKGTLITLPARRHLNDIIPDLSPYQIGCKIKCYGVLNKDDADILLPICMLKSAFETHSYMEKASLESLLVSKKRKVQENIGSKEGPKSKKKKKSDKDNVKNRRSERKDQQIDTEKVEWKLNCNVEQNHNKITPADDEKKTEDKKQDYKDDSVKNKTVDLSNLSISEYGFNWNNFKSKQGIESSSESEIEIETLNKKEKKKFNCIERQNIERTKERKVREREEVLATYQIPRTVHQFDRLVLKNPANSLVWVQYMVYNLQVTDIEKARSVARRALKAINFREENERLNIWQAWLNLESRFGSLESLNEVFEEALKTTSAERVCAHMLTLHLNAKRYAEIEKIVNIMVAKFKQSPDAWFNCGTAMLKTGLKDKSRHIMQRALQSLPKHKHIALIVKFGILESKFGNKERSQTLFESILEKYKSRTDVWSSYVDSLVNSGEIEIARKVLERAVTELISIKNIKVIFKKYISFEKKYGSLDQVLRIQQLAATYMKEQCNKVAYT